MAGLTTLSMCRINYGEVVYSVRKAFPADRAEDTLKAFREIAMQLYSVDDRLVDEAVDLKAMYSISYADASAAALTMRRGLPLVTGDAELVPLEKLGLRLHWVGQ
jgi:predicted nucleic acid-binding protein